MSTSPDPVLLDVSPEGIAVVTLNRPEKRNAFDELMIGGLRETFETLKGADHVRAVFLREQGQRTQAPMTSAPPPPEAYNFDPLTGQPINRSAPTTGRTINLRVDAPTVDQYAPTADTNAPSAAPQQPIYYGPPAPPARRHRGRSMGILLVAVGAIVLASQFDIAQYVFPILMIGAGILLLGKK